MFVQTLKEFNALNGGNILEKYIKQRTHFFSLRVSELKKIYNITEIEERILLGYLLSYEQEESQDNHSCNILRSLKKLNIQTEIVDDSAENKIFLGWLYIYWSCAWRRFALDNIYSLSARYVLNSRINDNEAKDPQALDDLISETKKYFEKADKYIKITKDSDKYGILICDKKALEFFKKQKGSNGIKHAINYFEKAIKDKDYNLEKRFDYWEDPLFFSKKLASALWLDQVRFLVKQKQIKPAAMIYPILEQITNCMVKKNRLSQDGTELVDAKGKSIIKVAPLAGFDIVTAQSILRPAVPLLASMTGQYLVRYIPTEVHKQFLLKYKEPRKLIIDGGYRKLAYLCGAGNSEKAAGEVRKIIHLLAGCIFSYKRKDRTGESNFLSFIYEEARGQNSSILIIELQPIACPGFVDELPSGGLYFQEQRQLVPIVGIPPLIGRKNDHSSICNFHWLLLIEMRLRAREMALNGGILLTDDDFERLAIRATMPTSLTHKVIDTWTIEKCLEQIKPNIFNLGSRYSQAKEMLFKAGEYIINGEIQGKKSKNLLRKNK